RLIEACRLYIKVARLEALRDSARLAFDREHRCSGHRRSERLRTAHAAEPCRQNPLPREIPAIVAPTQFHERFVGSLHDALRANVDPGSRGHLSIHHEPLPIELREMLPGGPMRHEI